MHKRLSLLRRFLAWLTASDMPAKASPDPRHWADLPTYHPSSDDGRRTADTTC